MSNIKTAEFEKELQLELDKLPYVKHVDDGQYNSGQLVGFELGARWAIEHFNQPSLPVDVEKFIEKNNIYHFSQAVIPTHLVRSLIAKVIKDKDEEIKKVVEGNRKEAIEFVNFCTETHESNNKTDKYKRWRSVIDEKIYTTEQLYDQYINQKQK